MIERRRRQEAGGAPACFEQAPAAREEVCLSADMMDVLEFA